MPCSRIMALAAALAATVWAAGRPWQQIQVPGYSGARQQFQNPPPEYAMVLWWFWNGPMTDADIVHDLDDMRAHNVRAMMLWPYYGIGIEYLSEQWFERVRFAVAQARSRDMRVWLMDEGSYPSGFVGGKISRLHPEARMQAMTVGEQLRVRGGETVTRDLPPDVVAAVARDNAGGRPLLLPASPGGRLAWTAPPGDWAVTIVRHEFRTSPTRYVNRPGFPKDSMYSLFDPLDPAATGLFLRYVHEEYKKRIGEEFGRTVLGFMGDEPSVSGVPWTAAVLAEFARRKGYDLRPLLPALFDPQPDRRARLVRADYWDVWTDLYSQNFFRPQTEWCAREGLEYVAHLCGEEDLKTLVALNGDYFKCMRTVQIPGVDAIWRQVWPGTIADYPKLASSAAHLHGRPRAFTESYAVYGQGLTLEQAKWVMDFQFVRGINHFQAMEYLSSNAEFRQYFHPPNWPGHPQWPYFGQLAAYCNRLSYLLSTGRPAAEIALYYPTTSGWMGDFDADKSALSLARQLLEEQRDFDFIDEDGLTALVEVRSGALRNRSGQAYRAVIVPAVSVMSREALDKLGAFARAGGRVIFTGRRPGIATGRSFLEAPAAEIGFPTAGMRDLPAPDLVLTPPAPAVKYLHRRLADAEVYFLFNEGQAEVAVSARFQGAGRAETWDALSGAAAPLGTTLHFDAYETRLVVVSPQVRPGAALQPRRLTNALDIAGEWHIDIGGKSVTSGLRPWADLGMAPYWGAAKYRRGFELPAVAKDLTLDLGEVAYAARVRLNGRDLGQRAWRPFRWRIAEAARAGHNVLEVEVVNTRANELSADPAHFREVEQKGWLKNSYIGMYGKFDAEMTRSGLLGPVRLLKPE